MRRNVLYQPQTRGRPPITPPQPYGAQGYEWTPEQAGPPQSKPNVALQQFSGWQPIGNVPSPVTPYGWWPEYRRENFNKPKPFDYSVWPAQAPVVVQPYGAAGYEYAADQSGQPQGKPNASLQQFEAARVPPPKQVTIAVGYTTELFMQTFVGDFDSQPPPFLPPSPPPSGAAGYEWTPEQVGQPQSKPNVTLQQHAAFQPQGIIVSITPQGWWQPFSEAKQRPLSPSMMQDSALGFTPIVPTGFFGWWQPLSVAIKLPFLEKPHATFQPQGPIFSITPQGASAFFDSVRVNTFGTDTSAKFSQFWAPPAFIQPVGAQGFEWTPERVGTPQQVPGVGTQVHAYWSPQAPTVVQPYGASGFFDSVRVPTVGADSANRFGTSFTPQGVIVSITPQGAGAFFDWIRVSPLGADTLTRHQTQVVLPAATPQGWLPAFDVPRPAPGKAAQPFSWDGSIPQPFIVTVATGFLGPFSEPPVRARAKWDYSIGTFTVAIQPYGAQGYDWAPEQVGTPQQKPSASGQQWTGFQPIGNVPTAPTPQGWWQPLDVRIVPPFKASLQQFDRSPTDQFIPGTPTQAFLGHWAFYDSARVPPVKASLQQHGAFQPQGNIFSITPQGFTSFYDRASYGRIAPDRAWGFQPLGTVVSSVPYGWAAFFDSAKPRAMSIQDYGALVRSPFIQPQGWSAFFDLTKLLAKPAADHGAFTSAPPAAPFVAWGWTASHDQTIRLPVKPIDYSAFVASTFVQPQGWSSFYDRVVVKPVLAALSRFGDFQPLGVVVTFVPSGWWQPFSTAKYGVLIPDKFGGNPPTTIITPPQFGWWQPFPNLLRSPIPSSMQQFEAHTFFQVPTQITPQGWWQPLSIATIRPLPASMTQWTGYQTIGPVPIVARIIGQPVLLGTKSPTRLKGVH